MAASDFFRDVGTSIFKPVGDFVGGAVTALQPGRAQQMELQRKKMQEFSESQRIQGLLRQAQTDALSEGRTIYGGGGTALKDPFGQASRLALAAERLQALGADEAAESVLGKINELTGVQEGIEKKEKTDAAETILSEYFQTGLKELEDKELGRASQKAVDKFEKSFAREAEKQGIDARNAELLFGRLYKEERGKAGIFRDDILPRRDVIDNRDYFSSPKGTLLTGEDVPEEYRRIGVKEYRTPFEDLPQAATPDFPEENIPKTFEQLGITQPQDQQTFQEMQDALPNVDLRQEYENDPQYIQRLMKFWQEKKLDKKNLRKAFSAIQQKAEQTLKKPGLGARVGLGIDKVAGKGMDRYQALERGVDKAFRRPPKPRTPRADATDPDQALMWMHWGEKAFTREVSARVQQYQRIGWKSETILKAIKTFPDPSKITVEELDAAIQGPKTLTEPEVRALLDEAGGDVEKARELAKQRNWTIPK